MFQGIDCRALGSLTVFAICLGCASDTGDGQVPRSQTATGGSAGATVVNGGSGGSNTAGTGPAGTGTGGTSSGSAGTGIAGSGITGGTSSGSTGTGTAGSGTAGTGTAGTGSGGTSGNGTAAGMATITISSFSLTNCSESASVEDLEAKNDGLTAPKPTQSFSAGTLSIDYTVTGQYGQVAVDFSSVDMTGCGISITLTASSWPTCGVFAVPFFYDATAELVAPYESGAMLFVGEEVSGESATIDFVPMDVTMSSVARVGINFYNCPDSVVAADL